MMTPNIWSGTEYAAYLCIQKPEPDQNAEIIYEFLVVFLLQMFKAAA